MSDTAILPSRREAAGATVYAEVEIAAPPEEVFRALVEPGQLAAWWGSEETYRTHGWETDARPGGRWSMRTRDAAGNEATVHGEYRVVEPPRRLEHTWRASWDGYAPTVVRYDLAPAVVDGAPGTRVTVTHTITACLAGTAAAGGVHDLRWARLLRRLRVHVLEDGLRPGLHERRAA